MNAALLVMDYQNGIVERFPNANALVANVRRAIDTVRARGGTAGYVRVAFTNADLEAVPARNKGFTAAKATGRDFRADSPATAIDARIAPEDGDEQLRRRAIDTLILAGLSTSGVVLSTVRDAADRDYKLFVLSDACADPNADVITIDELDAVLI